MANKTLFKSLIGKLVPATDAVNEERAPAYALSPKHQLAQYAATGCLNTTFYATADEQLAKVLELCADLDAEFIAKTAVFCRERGFMKDMSEPTEGSLEEPLTVLAELQQQGLIRHLGLSTVNPEQLAEGKRITEIVCVQNFYNVAHRNDDVFVDALAMEGIAYVPYFPLGGFTPLQSSVVDEVAASLKVTPMQVALAWLLQRSPNILLIPGTSSVGHLRENLAAAELELPPTAIAKLRTIDQKGAPG